MKSEPLRIATSSHPDRDYWYVDDYQILDFTTDGGWQRAIDIFEDRIDFRYLKIMKNISELKYSGFAIMSLCCLLIETLQQFYEGVDKTPGRNPYTGEGDSSGDYFRKFLTESSSFKPHFNRKKASFFYKKIRNGILHQAEIKGSSRIWIREGEPLVRISDDGDGICIHRELFLDQLIMEFKDYVKRLRKSYPPDNDLRDKFRTKMDYICKVK